MTDSQREALNLLLHCRMPPGSADGRFVQDLSRKPQWAELSRDQRARLGSLLKKFHRQVAELNAAGGVPARPDSPIPPKG